MAYAPNFDKHLKKYLEIHAPKLKRCSGWSAPKTRWKVDLVGFKSNAVRPSILVEVELKRDDPVGNVVKIWQWAQEQKSTRQILFVHAFSKHYWQRKSERAKKVRLRERADFVGRQMTKAVKIKYHPILMEYKPKMLPGFRTKAGAGRMILVEPDIDHYKDLAAHSLLEVIPNTVTHGLTNPEAVYVLRWIAGRHAGVAEFNPPYTIVS